MRSSKKVFLFVIVQLEKKGKMSNGFETISPNGKMKVDLSLNIMM